jgi:subtilisin family serine protease
MSIAIFSMTMALPLAAQAAGDSAKIGENLRSHLALQKSGTADILVYLGAKADLTAAKAIKNKTDKGRFVVSALRETARSSQESVLKLLKKSGATFTAYYIDNVIAVEDAPLALIDQLTAMKDVAQVLHNPTVRVLPPLEQEQLVDEREALPAGTFATGDNITSTGADQVWSQFNTRGEGTVVAGQDTGIQWDHPALVRNYRGTNTGSTSHDYNWHDAIRTQIDTSSNPCGYASRTPCDDHGHGTHTIGTAVGDDGAANQIGVAPGAKWIGCRNMDNGLGKPSTYLECFQFFLAPWAYGADPMTAGDPAQAPDVINNSWGCPTSEGCNGTEFLSVINALNAAGIMTVAAAGNDGSSCSTIKDAPAHHTAEVLTVGAHDHRSGTIASFSSRGPSKFDGLTSPDITAPGVNVRSSIPGSRYSGTMWSGTSMASPHVAGAVALLWAAVPDLRGQIDATVERFKATATAKTTSQTCGGVSGSTIPNNTYGHGHMNALKAATGG